MPATRATPSKTTYAPVLNRFPLAITGSCRATHIPKWDYPEEGLRDAVLNSAFAMPKSLNSARHIALMNELAHARKAAKLTQAAVAEALGRPQSYIAKIEGGERRIDVVEFLDLAEALEADPAKLLRRVSMAPKS